ncbi:transcription factor Adf-1-like [Harmonia axyridis]|uniref:transcription factor Adf-1-like n=1 Tax=Harmonia axyridis TaxID=115357 RepID=UPI001E276BDB|nr:transcription factor Adf-1-like [Harmonia axyridis]
MDHEKLIELVRSYSFLYDVSDRRYSDGQRKDEAWKEISKQLRFPKKDCKKIWASLRDAYRRALKKHLETPPNMLDNKLTRKWRFEDEMSFLNPFLKLRPTVCSEASNENEDSAGENSSGEENPGRPVTPYTAPQTYILPKETPVTQHPTSQSGSSPQATSGLKRTRIRQKPYTRYAVRDTSSTSLMKLILENKAKTNDIQQFFESIATTVQSFPPRERALAKAKVFTVISEMEIELLNRDLCTSLEDVGSPASYEAQKQEPMFVNSD